MRDDQQSLRDALRPLEQAEFQIGGCESLLSDVFSTVKENVKTGVHWVGAKAGDGAVKALRGASNALAQTLLTRRMKISLMAQKLRKEENVIKESGTFSASFLAKYTSSGSGDDLAGDLKVLLDVLKDINKFELDLEATYKKELALFKEMVNIKSTDSAVTLINKLDNLTYPVPDFSASHDSMLKSQALPGGKCFVFDKQAHLFSIESKELSAEQTSVSFAKEELVNLLRDINEIVDRYKVLSAAHEKYADYIRDFNTVVGKSFVHLETLKGSVSFNLIRDLESRLRGNPSVFSFYTGFLPKFTLYLDDYVDGLTTFLSKQLN